MYSETHDPEPKTDGKTYKVWTVIQGLVVTSSWHVKGTIKSRPFYVREKSTVTSSNNDQKKKKDSII